MPTRNVIVASPGYLERRQAPNRPGEIRDHEGIVMGASQKAGWGIANASVMQGSTLAVPDTETALAACVAGLGLALLPDFAVRASLHDGTLIHVLRDAETQQRDMAALVRNDATPATRLIIDRLRGALVEL